MILFFVVQILNVAIFRAANSGCYEQNPDERDFGAWRSLRYRIEMVQVSWWTDGGMECGALPAACAPVGVRKPSNITQQRCSVVGNDPCVVAFRGKDTFLWGVQIYPPHQLLNATASPRGEAFFTPCIHSKHNFMWQSHNTSIFRPVTLLCSAKGVLQKGFPSGGSCRVQRLMRGDKFPRTQRSPRHVFRSPNKREAAPFK